MIIVLDTNVFLVSISKKSKYRPIFDGILNKKYSLLISNEILTEYEEVITNRASPLVAHNVLEMLVTRSNVKKTEVYYRWNLIDVDKDDNKFADCAVAGNADFIVSDDKHFKSLVTREFPNIPLLDADRFIQKLDLS
ncbi:MAG: putative toxin-antitoxin system toxin component, PIN family [Tunicatimonas sp.]